MPSYVIIVSASFALGMLTSFDSRPAASLETYGKSFTAGGRQTAEAFAVKDGKYAYADFRQENACLRGEEGL